MALNFVIGDATNPIGPGTKIIAHICNNQGGWGRGFVLAISKKWKQPEIHYKNMFNKDLGSVGLVEVNEEIFVANMIAQAGYMSITNKKPVQYDYLALCLNKVREFATALQASVHMPRIGCGLGGGEWVVVESIVKKTLSDNNVQVFVYDLSEKERNKFI